MMRATSLLREAWLNVASGTARSATFFTLFMIVVSVLVAADLSSVRAIENAAATFRSSGASIVTIEAPGAIDGASCDDLSLTPGIHASGAMRRESTDLAITALPAAPAPLYAVSSGFAKVLGSIGGDRAGLVLPAPLADQLGKIPGDLLMLEGGAVPVSGVYDYPDDGRRAGLGYAGLSQALQRDNKFDECWAEIWPSNRELENYLSLVLIFPEASEVSVVRSQVNTTLGKSFDGASVMSERVTRWSFVVAAMICGLVAWLSTNLRRTQHASHLHLGATRSDLVVVAVLETVSWMLPAAVTFASAGVIIRELWGSGGGDVVWIIFGTMFTWGASGSYAGLLLGILTKREQSLFRFFKDR